MSSLTIHSELSNNLMQSLEDSIESRIHHLSSKIKEPSSNSCLSILFPGLYHHKQANGVEFHVFNTLKAAASPSFNEKYLTTRLSNIEHFGFANAFAILTNCIYLARSSNNLESLTFFQKRLGLLIAEHPNEARSIQTKQLAFNTDLVNPEYRLILDKAHAAYTKLQGNLSHYLGYTALAGAVLTVTVSLAWWISQKYAGQENVPIELPKTDPVKTPVPPSIPTKPYSPDSYQVGQKASILRNYQGVDSYASGLLSGERPLTDKDGYAELAAFGNKQNTPPQSTKNVKQPKIESHQNKDASPIASSLALVPIPASAEEIDDGQCLANLQELQCSVNERPLVANDQMQMVVYQGTPPNPVSLLPRDPRLMFNPKSPLAFPYSGNKIPPSAGPLVPFSSKTFSASSLNTQPTVTIQINKVESSLSDMREQQCSVNERSMFPKDPVQADSMQMAVYREKAPNPVGLPLTKSDRMFSMFLRKPMIPNSKQLVAVKDRVRNKPAVLSPLATAAKTQAVVFSSAKTEEELPADFHQQISPSPAPAVNSQTASLEDPTQQVSSDALEDELPPKEAEFPKEIVTQLSAPANLTNFHGVGNIDPGSIQFKTISSPTRFVTEDGQRFPNDDRSFINFVGETASQTSAKAQELYEILEKTSAKAQEIFESIPGARMALNCFKSTVWSWLNEITVSSALFLWCHNYKYLKGRYKKRFPLLFNDMNIESFSPIEINDTMITRVYKHFFG